MEPLRSGSHWSRDGIYILLGEREEIKACVFVGGGGGGNRWFYNLPFAKLKSILR